MFVSCDYEKECKNANTEKCKTCKRNKLIKDNLEIEHIINEGFYKEV